MTLPSLLLLWAGKSLLVLSTAIAFALIWRKKPAADQAVWWRCTFIVLVTIPLWSLTGLGWQAYTNPATPVGRALAPITYQVSDNHEASRRETPVVAHSGEGGPPSVADSGESSTPSPSRKHSRQGESGAMIGIQIPPSSPAACLLWIYFGGLSLALLRFIRAASVAVSAARSSKPALHPEFASLCESVGVTGVELRQLPDDEIEFGPMTLNVPRPVVLIPASLHTWSPEAQRVALLHELAHVRRKDWAVNVFAWLVSCIYWFNPLSWFAFCSLREQAERACDDEVLSMGVAPTLYAEQLLGIARSLRAPVGICFAVPMAQKPEVENRITSILDEGRRRTRLDFRKARTTVFNALVITLPLATFSACRAVDKPSEIGGNVSASAIVAKYAEEKLARETHTVPAGVISVKGFTARVAPGLTLKLSGISDRRSMNVADSWGPDGRPLTALGQVNSWMQSGADPDSSSRIFTFDVRTSAPGNVSLHVAAALGSDKMAYDIGASTAYEQAGGNRFQATLQTKESQGRLYCAVGRGQWHFSTTIPKSVLGTPTVPRSEYDYVSIGLSGKKVEAFVYGTNPEHHWNHIVLGAPSSPFDLPIEGEVRAVAKDRAGNVIQIIGPYLQLGTGAAGMSAADYARVDTLRIDVRPVSWFRFEGIHLNPSFDRFGSLKLGEATHGLDFSVGPVNVELQGLMNYQLVQGVRRPLSVIAPDGRLWARLPEMDDQNLTAESAEGTTPYTLLLRVTEPVVPGMSATVRAEVSEGDGPWRSAEEAYHSEQTQDGKRTMIIRLKLLSPSPRPHFRLRLRVADGAWATLAQAPFLAKKFDIPNVDFEMSPTAAIVYSDRQWHEHRIAQPFRFDSVSRDARIVGVTSDGQIVVPRGTSRTEREGKPPVLSLNFGLDHSPTMDPETQQQVRGEDIARFEYQARPFTAEKEVDVAGPSAAVTQKPL